MAEAGESEAEEEYEEEAPPEAVVEAPAAEEPVVVEAPAAEEVEVKEKTPPPQRPRRARPGGATRRAVRAVRAVEDLEEQAAKSSAKKSTEAAAVSAASAGASSSAAEAIAAGHQGVEAVEKAAREAQEAAAKAMELAERAAALASQVSSPEEAREVERVAAEARAAADAAAAALDRVRAEAAKAAAKPKTPEPPPKTAAENWGTAKVKTTIPLKALPKGREKLPPRVPTPLVDPLSLMKVDSIEDPWVCPRPLPRRVFKEEEEQVLRRFDMHGGGIAAFMANRTRETPKWGDTPFWDDSRGCVRFLADTMEGGPSHMLPVVSVDDLREVLSYASIRTWSYEPWTARILSALFAELFTRQATLFSHQEAGPNPNEMMPLAWREEESDELAEEMPLCPHLVLKRKVVIVHVLNPAGTMELVKLTREKGASHDDIVDAWVSSRIGAQPPSSPSKFGGSPAPSPTRFGAVSPTRFGTPSPTSFGGAQSPTPSRFGALSPTAPSPWSPASPSPPGLRSTFSEPRLTTISPIPEAAATVRHRRPNARLTDGTAPIQLAKDILRDTLGVPEAEIRMLDPQPIISRSKPLRRCAYPGIGCEQLSYVVRVCIDRLPQHNFSAQKVEWVWTQVRPQRRLEAVAWVKEAEAPRRKDVVEAIRRSPKPRPKRPSWGPESQRLVEEWSAPKF